MGGPCSATLIGRCQITEDGTIQITGTVTWSDGNVHTFRYASDVEGVPEPGTGLLLTTGVLALGYGQKRRAGVHALPSSERRRRWRVRCSLALLLLAFATPVSAQAPCGVPGVTITVSPQNALPGQQVLVTLTNLSGQTISLPSSCLFSLVFPGATCSGTPVLSLGCAAVITPVPSGSSYSQPWNQRDDNHHQVPGGVYSFGSGIPTSCCATVTIAQEIPAISPAGLAVLALLLGLLGLAWTWLTQRNRGRA